jgi:hypothetical protein
MVYTKEIKLKTVWHPGGWDFSFVSISRNFQLLKENLVYFNFWGRLYKTLNHFSNHYFVVK